MMHPNHSFRLKALFAALVLTGLAGCRSPAPVAQLPDRALRWPPPPAAARIEYEKSFEKPIDFGIKRSWWKAAGAYLVGSNRHDALFAKPTGLCFDEDGNLCVADPGTASIWFFDSARKRYKQWNRIGKIALSSPVAVAKQNGLFYVADSALGQIIVFNESGKLQFTISENLERPVGLALAGETLWVVDAARHRIESFDLQGKPLSGFGQRGTAPGEFNYPTHLAVAPGKSPTLFVTDSMNFRVQKLDAQGLPLQTFGALGNVSGSFSRPKGVATDRDGNLYVVDALFANIQIFDSQGRFLMHWGEDGSGAGQFWLPSGLAIDAQDRIWVADAYNHRIQQFKRIEQP